MASIVFDRVEKRFENGRGGVHDLSIDVADGELVVFVGPSGSGKSTALRLVAGLEAPSHGRILIGDRDVSMVGPQERDVAMVFQSYALYPHLSVRDNLAFGLRMRQVARGAIAERVRAVAASLQIGELLDRKPAQLSGGQRQRVALGRALVREPQAFLFDEPLSNLDAALRLETRAEIAVLQRQLKTTMIYVTHDQEEAMTLADRIVVMRDGGIEQTGPPLEVYARPASLFVARFVGSPPMNLLTESLPGLPVAADTILGIRPHDVTVVPANSPDSIASAVIGLVEPIGSEQRVHVRLGDRQTQTLVAVAPPDALLSVGSTIGLRVPTRRMHVFDRRSGRRLGAPRT